VSTLELQRVTAALRGLALADAELMARLGPGTPEPARAEEPEAEAEAEAGEAALRARWEADVARFLPEEPPLGGS